MIRFVAIVGSFLLATVPALAQQQDAVPSDAAATPLIRVEFADAVAFYTADGAQRPMSALTGTSNAVTSPTGRYVARPAPHEGRATAALIIDDTQDGTTYTYPMERPRSLVWYGEHRLALVGGRGPATRVYRCAVGEGPPLAHGQRLSQSPRAAGPDRLAFLVERKRDGKARYFDLVLEADGQREVIVADEVISDHAWTADGSRVAFGTLERFEIMDLTVNFSRVWPYRSISKDLYAHQAQSIAWAPDAATVAAVIRFVGGREAGIRPDGTPADAMPVLFGDREVFVFRLQGAAVTPWFTTPHDITGLSWTGTPRLTPEGRPAPPPMLQIPSRVPAP